MKDFVRLLAKLEVHKPGPSEDQEVFYENGMWFFYDETWVNVHGPYNTRADANAAIDRYAETL